MKKLLAFITILLLSFTLMGCENEVKANPEGIKFYLDDEFYQYMPYSEGPIFVFSDDQNLNTILLSKNPFQEILSGNDDFVVSEQIEKLFNKYQDNITFKIDSYKNMNKTRINSLEYIDGKKKIIKHKLEVDPEEIDGGTYRTIYNEIAFILLENGLQLSLEYRRFNSGGKTYYTWQYQKSIFIYLHYPLLVSLNKDGKKELVIVPLPLQTKYKVGPQLVLDKIINNDDYLKESFRTYEYPPHLNKSQTISFYTKFHQGTLINDNQMKVNYLGVDFKIDFKDDSFIISRYE